MTLLLLLSLQLQNYFSLEAERLECELEESISYLDPTDKDVYKFRELLKLTRSSKHLEDIPLWCQQEEEELLEVERLFESSFEMPLHGNFKSVKYSSSGVGTDTQEEGGMERILYARNM
jgi:hypothetical protein